MENMIASEGSKTDPRREYLALSWGAFQDFNGCIKIYLFIVCFFYSVENYL
jgi:hypothetical protein